MCMLQMAQCRFLDVPSKLIAFTSDQFSIPTASVDNGPERVIFSPSLAWAELYVADPRSDNYEDPSHVRYQEHRTFLTMKDRHSYTNCSIPKYSEKLVPLLNDSDLIVLTGWESVSRPVAVSTYCSDME